MSYPIQQSHLMHLQNLRKVKSLIIYRVHEVMGENF